MLQELQWALRTKLQYGGVMDNSREPVAWPRSGSFPVGTLAVYEVN